VLEVAGGIATYGREGQGSGSENPIEEAGCLPVVLRRDRFYAFGDKFVVERSAVAFANRLLDEVLSQIASGSRPESVSVVSGRGFFALPG
jgi:hypothetical protein